MSYANQLIKKIITVYFFVIIILCRCTFSQAAERYELTSISFTGNKTIASSDLSEIILSKVTPWWGLKFINSFTDFGAPPVYFDSSLLAIDVRAIKMFYKSNGFFMADAAAEYVMDSTSNSVDLLFKIEENNSFNYNHTSIYGLDKIAADLQEMIREILYFDSSERYSESEVELKVEGIIEVLNDNGYLSAVFDSTIILIDSIKNNVNLHIFMNKGLNYKISDIVVEKTGSGQNEVSDALIKEVTNFKQDEYFNLSKMRWSQQRLYRTELFNSVMVEADYKSANNEFMPLLVKADVSDLNELFPEIIANDQQGHFNLGLGATYKRKNFLGEARRLNINLQGLILDVPHFNFYDFFRSPDVRDTTFQGQINASLKIEQPYLFGKPLSTSLELYYESSTIKKTTVSNFGVKTILDFEMKPYTFINSLSPYFNLEYSEVIPNLSVLDLKFEVSSITSVLGIEFGSSHTDNLQYPSSGHNLSFIVEGATSATDILLSGRGLLADIGTSEINISERAWFYSFQAMASAYFNLSNSRRIVHAVKFKTGYIQTISGEYQLIPPNRTFVAGGASSVRGWGSRQLLPKDTVEYFGLTKGNILRGGTFLLEGSFEFRNRFGDNFGVVLFADYGNTWNGYKSFNFSDVAAAAGLGFRYYTSIVPFRVDFGFKFYDPYSRKFLWKNWQAKLWNNIEFNFGIGEAF